MIMKDFVIIFILSCCALRISAQPGLPPKVMAGEPALLASNNHPATYKLRLEFRNGSKWGQNKTATKTLWVVYSDRAKNPTYTSPEKSTRFGELMFGEKVCIAKIEGDMALVYSDEKAHYPKIPGSIKSKGWIPMANLLLWRKCPLNQNGLRCKGIIPNSLSGKRGNQESKYYVTPDDLTSSRLSGNDLRFYYIMKESENGQFLLLSTSASINSAQSLYGWVDRKDFVELSQRVFAEPNWDKYYVEENRGRMMFVYDDKEQSSVISSWKLGEENNDTSMLYKYRMDPNRMRFPVLSHPDANGLVSTSFFGQSLSFSKEFLRKKLGTFGYDAFIQSNKSNLYCEGYIQLSSDWKFVLFLSQDELREIMELLRPLAEAVSTELRVQNNNRTVFTETLEEIVKGKRQDYINVKDKGLDEMTLGKIRNFIYGIDMIEDSRFRWAECTIGEIRNPAMVTDFFDLCDLFEKKYQKLSMINAGNGYRMNIGGMYYYWIPFDDLP